MINLLASNKIRMFRKCHISELVGEAEILVPEGVWVRIKVSTNNLRLCQYDLAPATFLTEELRLNIREEIILQEGNDYFLQPSDFFRILPCNGLYDKGEASFRGDGVVEFFCLAALYANKKFNSEFGLGQAHSEVSYFKAYYASLLPHFQKSPLNVLDLGCGRGRNAMLFAQDREQDYHVLGIDQSRDSLDVFDAMAKSEHFFSDQEFRSIQANLNTWRESPTHDIAMAIVSLQFLAKEAAPALLCHCMEKANVGALHLAVFPIESTHPKIVWPPSFSFLPESEEMKYLYMEKNWSILEYRESYGHLGAMTADRMPLRGVFATLIAQKKA